MIDEEACARRALSSTVNSGGSANVASFPKNAPTPLRAGEPPKDQKSVPDSRNETVPRRQDRYCRAAKIIFKRSGNRFA